VEHALYNHHFKQPEFNLEVAWSFIQMTMFLDTFGTFSLCIIALNIYNLQYRMVQKKTNFSI